MWKFKQLVRYSNRYFKIIWINKWNKKPKTSSIYVTYRSHLGTIKFPIREGQTQSFISIFAEGASVFANLPQIIVLSMSPKF